ncbi:S-adenosyl-L-methionine-dependent methyltransferase [Zopfia rhizophila CBS 207.26]|uniref:S-adenosyl-L-methionine-dependent methyltransferase n=1 Tax=Zopfia rhizophila CBS 207.26 TaxID=1314779 RepID=A0A6A6D8G1_9PEZI|nr:S-adenosyl-L-methionine-dependent methyltransferase [Zopfia rhizophila CBS 207.26]
MATQNQDRLRDFFTGHDPSTHSSRWDDLWRAANFLPWDRGFANPALIDLLNNPSSHNLSFGSHLKPDGSRKRVLVPGCGTGYDLVLFAAHGYDAYGIEVSENAVQACKKFLSEPGEGKEVEYKARDEKVGKGRAECLLGDFFKDDWVDRVGRLGEGFNIIYDNTFLCALPLSLRSAWALRMSQLLSPTGTLICLEFPTHKPPSSGGPPWAVPSVVYEELFKRPGEEIQYDEEGKVVRGEKEKSEKALVRIAHWKPERTHAVGIVGGEVRDWVSVWRHK